MTTELAVLEPKEVDLVKRTVATGATDDELKLYFYDCQRRGVHPLDKLIHFTKRGGKYVPITSIDFMRQRATASGAYAGKDPSIFKGEPGKAGFEATLTVYRLVQGVRCAWTSTARWSEYFPGEQQGHMWKKMPHVMLEKCAEALALRQAFPNELQGLYTKEEMEQADEKPKAAPGSLRERVIKQVVVEKVPAITKEQFESGLDNDAIQFMDRHELEPYKKQEAGPVLASVPTSEPPQALHPPSTEFNRPSMSKCVNKAHYDEEMKEWEKGMRESINGGAPPIDDEKPWQKGIVTAITKADKLTRAKKPWGTITLETIEGTVIEATWFGFSHPWSYETIKEQLCGKILDVEYVLTPANDPKYKPTLEHFRVPQ